MPAPGGTAMPTALGARLWTARMRATPSRSTRLMTPLSASSSSAAQLAVRLGVQASVQDGHRGGFGQTRQVAELIPADASRADVEQQRDSQQVVADQQRNEAGTAQTRGLDLYLGAGWRGAHGMLPLGIGF